MAKGRNHPRAAARASGVTALLFPLLAAAPSAPPSAFVVTGPATTSAAVGASTPVPGASVSGMEAATAVRVLVGVASGTLSVPAASAGVTAPVGYPVLGAEGPELALEGTQDALNATLAQLRWTPAAAGPVAVTIDASPAGAAYDAANGHYYQLVTPAQGVDWTSARTAAAAATFAGQAGYLATITDAREEAVVAQVTTGPAWIGARREANSQDWGWATGPESGDTFWTPDCGVGTQGECQSSAGPTFAMWAPGEPGSFSDASAGTFLGGTGSGQWAPSAPSATPPGLVVEFGGTDGDETPAVAHADSTFTATGGGITPVMPDGGGMPVRSIPTTTTTEPPTTTTPTTEPVTAPPATPATTVATSPPRTAPPVTTTVETAPPVVVTAVPDTSSEAATATADADTTTSVPVPPAPSSLPVYIVFDVPVGTPLAGVKVTVRGYGLQADSALTVTAHSTPELLASAPVDATGVITTDVALPADLADGEHVLVANATAADGTPLERQAPFALAGGVLSRIGAPAATPATTSPPTTVVGTTAAATPDAVAETSSGSGGLPKPLIIVLLAAVAGGMVWLVTRRRKSGDGSGGTPPPPQTDGGTQRATPGTRLPDPVDQFR